MPPKNDKTMVVFMIIALIAFCIGAGMGVSISISGDSDDVANNTTHVENVTQEMTTNLDESDNNDTVLDTNQSNITYEEDINLNYTN